MEIVEPETSIGVEEQVFGVGGPDVGGHLVALPMIAVLLGAVSACKRCELCAAHQNVRLSPAGVKIDELATIEVGEVLAVGRPGDATGRSAGERAVGEDLLHSERNSRSLGEQRRNRVGENENDGK